MNDVWLTLLPDLWHLCINRFPPFHLSSILGHTSGLLLLHPFLAGQVFCWSQLGGLLVTYQLTWLETCVCLPLPSVVNLDQTLDFFHLAVVTCPTFPAKALLTHFEAMLARQLGVVCRRSADISTWWVAVNGNAHELATFGLLVIVVISQWLEGGIVIRFHVRCYKGLWFERHRPFVFLWATWIAPGTCTTTLTCVW